MKNEPIIIKRSSTFTNLHTNLTILYCFLINLLIYGTQYTTILYLNEYKEKQFPREMDWQISLIGTISVASVCIFGPITGSLADSVGYKKILCSGVVIYCLGLFLASLSQTILQFQLTQGLLCGIGSSLTFFPLISIASLLFNKNRALATGIVGAGIGVGGIIFSPLSDYLICNFGFRFSLRVTSIGIALLALICVFLIRLPPRIKNSSGLKEGRKLEPKKLLKLMINYKFILLFLAGFIATFSAVIPYFMLSGFALRLMINKTEIAILVSIINGASAIGRVGFGKLADKIGRLNVLILSTILNGMSILCVWFFAHNFIGLILFVIAHGLTSGTFLSLANVVIGDLLNKDNVATLTGMVYFSIGVSNLIGTPVANFLLDKVANYNIIILIVGFPAILAASIMLVLRLMVDRSFKKV